MKTNILNYAASMNSPGKTYGNVLGPEVTAYRMKRTEYWIENLKQGEWQGDEFDKYTEAAIRAHKDVIKKYGQPH